MRALTFLFVLLLEGASGAQGLKEDLTPDERAAVGDTTYGVFDIADPARCPPAAVKRFILAGLIAPETDLGKNALGQPITAKGYAENMRQTLQRALDQLKANGDTVAASRHLCVGLADFGDKGPNAISMRKGYIVADPRLTNLVNSLPDRTMFSLDMFWVHELAHQLQYWNGNPFEKDARDRRTELAADCAASAIVAMRWSEPFALKDAADGVVAAAVSVGDLAHESSGHHGTPVERRAAARAGVDAVLAARTRGARLPTGKELLGTCNGYIVARDKASGPNWKAP